MAKYKKKCLQFKKEGWHAHGSYSGQANKNGEKKVAENYCQVLSSRGSFGSLVSGKLILFPVSSGQRAGIFSVMGEEPNT